MLEMQKQNFIMMNKPFTNDLITTKNGKTINNE